MYRLIKIHMIVQSRTNAQESRPHFQEPCEPFQTFPHRQQRYGDIRVFQIQSSYRMVAALIFLWPSAPVKKAKLPHFFKNTDFKGSSAHCSDDFKQKGVGCSFFDLQNIF